MINGNYTRQQYGGQMDSLFSSQFRRRKYMKARRLLLSLTLIVALLVISLGSTLRQAQAQQKLSGKLEIFSWWAGDEAPALEALLKLYGQKYPDVQVTNATVAGGSGVHAKAVLKTRIVGVH